MRNFITACLLTFSILCPIPLFAGPIGGGGGGSGDGITADSSDTLTNKTYDADGTGNTLTLPSEWQIPTVSCAGTAGTVLWDTPASLAPTATCSAGSTNTALVRGVADFPDSDGDYSMQTSLALPAGWTGTVDLAGQWRTTATSGDVVWQVQTVCRADGEVDDAAWNAAQTIVETAKGTTNQLNELSLSGVTMTGCAAGELFHLRILRNRTHASDTIAAVVSLAGPIRLTMRRAL